MKNSSILCFALFIFWVLIAIIDIWFDVVSTSVFVKITMTFALVLVIIVSIALFNLSRSNKKDFNKNNSNKSGVKDNTKENTK